MATQLPNTRLSTLQLASPKYYQQLEAQKAAEERILQQVAQSKPKNIFEAGRVYMNLKAAAAKTPAQKMVEVESRLYEPTLVKNLPTGELGYKNPKVQALQNRAEQLSQREANLQRFKQKVFRNLRISDDKNLFEQYPVPGALLTPAQNVYAMGLGKTLARLPLDIASIPVTVGGRLALAADAMRTPYGRQVLESTKKEARGTFLQSFDVRNPQGLVNLLLTATMVREIAGARTAKVAQAKAIKEELKTAKIENAKVSVKELKSRLGESKYLVDKKGTIRIGDQKVPFEEKTIVTKKQLGPKVQSKRVTSTGRTSSRNIGGPSKITAKSTITYEPKGQVPSTSKVNIIAREVSYADQAALNDIGRGLARENIVETVGRVKGRGIKAEFISKQTGKRISTIVRDEYLNRLIDSKIGKVTKSIKGAIDYDLKSSIKSLPLKKAKLRETISKIFKDAERKGESKITRVKIQGSTEVSKLLRKLKNTRVGQYLRNKFKDLDAQYNRASSNIYDSKGAAKARAVAKAIRIIAEHNKLLQTAKRMLKSKRGEILPGTRPSEELISRTPGRDTTAADRILDQLEKKLKMIEKARGVAKEKTVELPIASLDALLPGLKSALIPKVLPLFPALPIIKTASGMGDLVEALGRAGVIAGGKVIPLPETIPESYAGPEEVPDTTPDTGSKADVTNYNSSVIYQSFFSYPAIASLVIPRLIPLLPLMPGISSKAVSGFFRRYYPRARPEYNYIPDLPSLMYGIKARRQDIAALTRPGRIFTGYEARPIV